MGEESELRSRLVSVDGERSRGEGDAREVPLGEEPRATLVAGERRARRRARAREMKSVLQVSVNGERAGGEGERGKYLWVKGPKLR